MEAWALVRSDQNQHFRSPAKLLLTVINGDEEEKAVACVGMNYFTKEKEDGHVHLLTKTTVSATNDWLKA